ncbi:MAG: molybdopterin converting factor subunit 1 [Parasphingorhabdus sp.]
MNIVYFAWVKERIGKGEERLELPCEVVTISDFVAFMSERAPEYKDVFADLGKLRFALDQEFSSIDSAINDAEELAIFPPVTGG